MKNIGIKFAIKTKDLSLHDPGHLSYLSVHNSILLLTDTGKNSIYAYQISGNKVVFINQWKECISKYNVACAITDGRRIFFIDRLTNSIVAINMEGVEVTRLRLTNKARLLWGLSFSSTGSMIVTCEKTGGIIEFDSAGNIIFEYYSDNLIEPRSVIKLGQKFLVLDSSTHCVYSIFNNNMKVQYGKYGNPGGHIGQFTSPWGMALSGKYIYVCDSRNERIIRINTKTSEVMSLINNNSVDFNNILYIKYNMQRPISIFVQDHLVYVLDSTAGCVKSFNADNGSYISVLVGDDVEYYSCLRYPRSVELFDSYLIVTDSGNHSVKLFEKTNGKLIDEITFDADEIPRCAIVSNNRIIVSVVRIMENSKSKIYILQIIDTRLTVLQSFDFTGYSDIHSICRLDKYFYISDSLNNIIYKYEEKSGSIQSLRIGTTLLDPHYCSVLDNDSLLVADTGNNRVLILGKDGNVKREISHISIRGKQSSFRFPRWCAQIENHIYIIDSGNSRILILNNILECVNVVSSIEFPFNRPHWLCYDRDQRVFYISDFMNHRIAVCEKDLMLYNKLD